MGVKYDGKRLRCLCGCRVNRCLGVEKVKDVLKMVGMELAFRCARSTPSQDDRETSRRELISPILYAAAYLSSR